MSLLKQHSIYLVFALLLCSACNNTPDVAFEKTLVINNGLWDKSNVASIDMPVDDTLQFYDMQVYVRNRNDYPFSNLYLFITVTAPSGATVTDTMNYVLADDHGKWRGKGSSQLWDNRFSFRNNIRFISSGNYNVQIRHGMRDEDLESEHLSGITDIGVRLVKVGNY